MKFTLPFAVIRVGEHAPPDRPHDVTHSLRMVPVHDADPRSAARLLWPNGGEGEILLAHCDPDLIRDIRAGAKVQVTFEIPS